MLTWFPSVNEIKVQTWRRETVETSSDGGVLIKTARKFLVFFFFRREHGAVSGCPRSEGQKCRGENTHWTGPSARNNKARRERDWDERGRLTLHGVSSQMRMIWSQTVFGCVCKPLLSETHRLHRLDRLPVWWMDEWMWLCACVQCDVWYVCVLGHLIVTFKADKRTIALRCTTL